MTNIIKDLEADEAKLSVFAKGALKDGVKIGGSVAAVLVVVSNVLPHVDLPAGVDAYVSGASAVVAAFLSWASRHGIVAAKARAAK